MQQRVQAIKLILGGRLDNKAITAATRLSRNTVGRYRSLIEAKGITPKDVEGADPEKVLALFNKPRSGGVHRRRPDWQAVHRDLRKHRHRTRQAIWKTYSDADPSTAMSYPYFTASYAQYLESIDISTRLEHVPGDALMVDFSGDGPLVKEPNGRYQKKELFVAVCPASARVFAYAVDTQTIPDWLLCNQKMLEFFGGVPRAIVTDNLASAVKRARRCGVPAEIQQNYDVFALHYGTAILPARAYHARDKGAVENAVHIAQQHILDKLEDQQFSSLEALNAAMVPLLDALNESVMKDYGLTRNQRWAKLSAGAFAPLAALPYEYVEWMSSQKVQKNCHIKAKGCFYSVPYQLRGQTVDVRLTHSHVDVYQKGKRLVRHDRLQEKGSYAVDRAHLTEATLKFMDCNPEGMRRWASGVGPSTVQVVEAFLGKGPAHAGVRDASALQGLAEKKGTEVVERACRQALAYPSVTMGLLQRLVSLEAEKVAQAFKRVPPPNRNARGSASFVGGAP